MYNPIKSHIPFEPTTGQWLALQKLDVFIEQDFEVFILQGYAGTGKTTLMKGVLDYLDTIKRPYRLMASTGRAAKVLANKTSRKVLTIHSTIYSLDEAKSKVDEKQKLLAFKLRLNLDPPDTIYFVDEASMIADKTESNQSLLFDDGRFLDHIFRYVGRRKIVFVGDTAQLPPVNCSFSAAMSADYLTNTYRKKVVEVALTDVKRQNDYCGIIDNATKLREKLVSGRIPPIGIEASGWDDISVSQNIWNAIAGFSRQDYHKGPDHSIFIALSNGSTHFINQQIRKSIYRENDPQLKPGDWLMVIQNNSVTGYNNGQHLILKSFSDTNEQVGEVHLIDAVVEDPDSGEEKMVKMIKDLLFSAQPNTTFEQDKAFTVDFAIRMKKYGIRPGSEEFISRLMFDHRLNALKVKFGYAVTCHKAQGGEWKKVFIHLEPAFEKLQRDAQYRWMYTAITRASDHVNFPSNPIIF